MLHDAYADILELADAMSVAICVENTMNFHLPFVGRALDGLLRFDSLGLTWDAGHDARCGFREKPVFDRYPERIKHMHLHDCDGQSDHRPLYAGIVPVDERLRLAEALGLTVVIEVKTGAALRESVNRLRTRFAGGR